MNKIRVAGIAATASLLAAPFSTADLSSYTQNLEGVDATAADALGAVGWVVFGNVYDPTGVTYLYGYGVFPAPNGSGGFSNVAVGEGGPDQGAQQMVVFNDYNNADHNVGNRIESNVFVEQAIGAPDVGKTYTFKYDAKAGDLAGASTALAFIKTLDPNAGFATTNFLTNDTTNLPATWAGYELSITIDAGLVGQLLQFGFASTAANFDPSGVVYDNIEFGTDIVDSDGDGVGDDVDNCTEVANADQRDTNGDGFGNICDTDITNDCVTNVIDLGLLRTVFFTADPDADFNGNGVVNAADLGVMKSRFFMPPGPAASACVP